MVAVCINFYKGFYYFTFISPLIHINFRWYSQLVKPFTRCFNSMSPLKYFILIFDLSKKLRENVLVYISKASVVSRDITILLIKLTFLNYYYFTHSFFCISHLSFSNFYIRVQVDRYKHSICI